MNVYVVTAARLNAKGHPVALKMGTAYGGNPFQWIKEPSEIEAYEVASLLLDGKSVTTVFPNEQAPSAAAPA